MPSWGWMVIKGPGTIWESWTDSTNSHNHPALSADIGVYLYSLAGLEPVDRWGLFAADRIRAGTSLGFYMGEQTTVSDPNNDSDYSMKLEQRPRNR